MKGLSPTKFSVNIIVNAEPLETFPLKSETRHGWMPDITTRSQYNPRDQSQCNKMKKYKD